LNKVVFALTVRSTVVAISILILGGAVFCYLTGREIGLFLLTGLLLAVSVRRELGIQLLISERKQQGANLLQASDCVLRLLLAIWFVWGLGQNPEAVLLGYVIASVVSIALSTVISGERQGKHRIKQSFLASHYKRDICKYALSLIPLELVFWFNGLSDRYVLGCILTAADVGLYVAAYTIVGEAFNRSAMALLSIFQPRYSQYFFADKQKEAFSVLWLWIAAMVGVCIAGVGVVLIGKEYFASLFLANSYQAAIELMPIIAIGAAFNAIGTVVAQPLQVKKHTKTLFKGRVCGALAAIISLPLMVSAFGLMGAAIANAIYFGIETLVIALLARPWNIISSGRCNQTEPSQVQAMIDDYDSDKSVSLSTVH